MRPAPLVVELPFVWLGRALRLGARSMIFRVKLAQILFARR